MLRKWAAVLITLLALVLVLGGCETEDEGADGGTTVKDGATADSSQSDGGVAPDSAQPPSGLVTHKQANESADLDFSNGDEVYVVAAYSASNISAESISFDVKLSGAKAAAKSFASKQQRPPLRVRNPALWNHWQARLKADQWARELARQAAKSPMSAPLTKHMASCTLSSECGTDEVCHGGSCAKSVTLNVEVFTPSEKTIDAEVKKKGTTAAVLVEKGTTISSSDLDTLLDTFEKTIYGRDVALFGNPALKSGEQTKASDRNGDGLIWLVLTDNVETKGYVGSFAATDFTDNANSNKSDILYAMPPGSETPLKKIYPILAHELQHLLNYAAKVYKPTVNGQSGGLEALWLDEGLAHFAEDACGYGGENVTVLDDHLFPEFADTRMFETEQANDKLPMRGLAMTFVRYLFEQKGGVSYSDTDAKLADKGGAAWLQALLGTTKIGTEAIDATYGDHKTAFKNWVAAIVLDGRNVTSYPGYVFAPVLTDKTTGNTVGLKIRGKRKDADGADVDLLGPEETAISSDTSGSIVNSTAAFYLIKGQSGTVKVTVETQEKDFGFAVIKVK